MDLEIQTLLFTLHGKNGVLVDRIKMADGHSTQPGDTIEFPCHFAKIRSQILDHWKVSYTTRRDIDRGRFNSYDGRLSLWHYKNCLVLKNAKEESIAE